MSEPKTQVFRADLHCHSTFSDGSYTPHELVDLALTLGLSGLSITDHDTTAAYPEVFDYAQTKGLLMLSGIELSASYREEPVHILGYGFDIASEALGKLCSHHQTRRERRNLTILHKLSRLGIAIDPELLQGQMGTCGRPHIAHLLMEKGYVGSIQEAFDRYLGEGKAAFDPGELISVEETIETIKKAKGKAILAHPHLIKKSSTVKAMLKMPFDGLEGYYARMLKSQEQKWLRLAQEKGWLITGGSDFHGATKPQSRLGSSWVNQEIFERLST